MKLNLKMWTIIDLLILGLIGGWHYGYGTVVPQVLAAVLICTALGAFANIFKKKKWFSQSALITGLIIGLVLAPGEALWRVFFVCVIAMASKLIFKNGPKHIFNPAAFGLAAGLLFGARMGWWAAYSTTATIIIGAHLLYLFAGRWKMIFSFFTTILLLIGAYALLTGASFTDQTYLVIGISFFFVFFMLTDPMTSPFRPWDLIIFGIIAAAGSFASVLYLPSTVFIGGLLIANAAVPLLNKINVSKLLTK